MLGVVDIYVKLIIAVLGFIAPMAIYFLNSSLQHIGELRKLLPQFRNQLEHLQKNDHNSLINLKEIKKDTVTPSELITIALKHSAKQAAQQRIIDKEIKKSKKAIIELLDCLHYVEIEKRTYTIFFSLLLSLVVIMLYHFARVDIFKLFSSVVRQEYLSLSFILLFIGLSLLYLIIRIRNSSLESSQIHKISFINRRMINLYDMFCVNFLILFLALLILKTTNITAISINIYWSGIIFFISLFFFLFSIHKIRKVFQAGIYLKKIISDGVSDKPHLKFEDDKKTTIS